MGADLTASGVTLGTFDYISPEQARDPRNADIRSDIYSLGCTFYFMLTGRPPFPEGTVLQKLLQHHSDPPPDVRQHREDLPEEANRIMQKMMAKDPSNRYLDPGELIADLTIFSPADRFTARQSQRQVMVAQIDAQSFLFPPAFAVVGIHRRFGMHSDHTSCLLDDFKPSGTVAFDIALRSERIRIDKI